MYGNYHNRIKNYKETDIYYKILVDNMFWNYFLISYRCHKFVCPISVYIFTKQRCEYFPEETISVFFLNHLCRVSNGANILLICNRNRCCDKHQTLKRIDFNFVRKQRTGCRSNGGTSHLGLCETKLNNSSMLCIIFFLYCI